MRKRFAAAVASLLIALGVPASGQNRLGVDDDVFKSYTDARFSPYDGANLAVADSILELGQKREDPKLRMLAYGLALPVHAVNGNQAAVDSITAAIRELLISYPETLDIYSELYLSFIQHDLDLGRELQALKEAAGESASGRISPKLQTYAMAALIIALILAIILLIINASRRRRHQKVLKLKNDELEKAHKAIEAALKKARKASDTKTRFLQNMSHEIRTPLNAVAGFAQLLAMPDGFIEPEEREEYRNLVMSNTNLLTMLIDDILNLSDVESGNYSISREMVRCNDICREALKSVEYRAKFGVDMCFTTNVDDNYLVNTDARRVQQVLINFLTNACKHTEKGGIVLDCNVSVTGEVVFSVTDTGTGVPEDKSEMIFDRFTKLDPFKQGTGLGLSVCRVIAEKLGGDVFLDKNYTSGARFLFVLRPTASL